MDHLGGTQFLARTLQALREIDAEHGNAHETERVQRDPVNDERVRSDFSASGHPTQVAEVNDTGVAGDTQGEGDDTPFPMFQ